MKTPDSKKAESLPKQKAQLLAAAAKQAEQQAEKAKKRAHEAKLKLKQDRKALKQAKKIAKLARKKAKEAHRAFKVVAKRSGDKPKKHKAAPNKPVTARKPAKPSEV